MPDTNKCWMRQAIRPWLSPSRLSHPPGWAHAISPKHPSGILMHFRNPLSVLVVQIEVQGEQLPVKVPSFLLLLIRKEIFSFLFLKNQNFEALHGTARAPPKWSILNSLCFVSISLKILSTRHNFVRPPQIRKLILLLLFNTFTN